MHASTLTDEAKLVRQLADKQEIAEVLYRRARAGDHKDIPLALSCYHPGATEDHEGFTGSAEEFIGNRSLLSKPADGPVKPYGTSSRIFWWSSQVRMKRQSSRTMSPCWSSATTKARAM